MNTAREQQNGDIKKEERERPRQKDKISRTKQSMLPFVGKPEPEQIINFNFTPEEMMTKEEIDKLKVADCFRDRLLPTEREVVDDSVQVTGKHADLLVLSAPYADSEDEAPVRLRDSSEHIMADVVGNFNKLSLDTRSLFSMRHSTQIRPQEGLSKERYIQWRINQYKDKRSEVREAMENHSLSLIPINYHSHGPYESTALSLRPFVGAATACRQRADPYVEVNLDHHAVQICSHTYTYRRVQNILPKAYHRILPEYLVHCPCLRMSYGADCDCQKLVDLATYKLHLIMLKIAEEPPDNSQFEKTTGLETNVEEIVRNDAAGSNRATVETGYKRMQKKREKFSHKAREKTGTTDDCWKGTCTHFGNPEKEIERDPLAGAQLGCRSCQLELNEDGQAGDEHSPGLLLGVDQERYIIPKYDWLPDIDSLTNHEAAVLQHMMNRWIKSNKTEKWWDMMANLFRRVYLSSLHEIAIRPALLSVLNTDHQCEQCEYCCCEQKSILAISRIGQFQAPFDADAMQMSSKKREEKKKTALD